MATKGSTWRVSYFVLHGLFIKMQIIKTARSKKEKEKEKEKHWQIYNYHK